MQVTEDADDTLAHVDAGTPMGDLLRRYWVPACLSEEVAEPDGPVIRVRLFGEDLICFRDSKGEVGLVDAYCAHRWAPLFAGMNEECGIRCVYHGWKFDVHGRCVDIPGEPAASEFRHSVSITAYPTHEAGGILWAYLGPSEQMPPPPDYEWLRAPLRSNLRLSKTGEHLNWLEALEAAGGALVEAEETIVEIAEAPFGLTISTTEELPEERRRVRISHYVMPNQLMLGAKADPLGALPRLYGCLFVPLDAANTYVYRWSCTRDDSSVLSDEAFEEEERLAGRAREDYIARTYWLKANEPDAEAVDRQLEATRAFTGIHGAPSEESAPAPRSEAFPVTSAPALAAGRSVRAAIRERLSGAARGLAAGRPPSGTDPQASRQLRAAELALTRGLPWREAAEEATTAFW
jgi:nitrite reductase/ring-hydroxylating ferredoxin subunit